MPKVYNNHDPNAPIATGIYIGRPSKWGNPFAIGKDGTRAKVIEKYELHLHTSGLIHQVEELKGKDLICWCKPLACHGDILLELANKE